MNKFTVRDAYDICFASAYATAVNDLKLDEESARRSANIFAVNNAWIVYNNTIRNTKDEKTNTK